MKNITLCVAQPVPLVSDCRSLTCGRCTRNAAGISSPPETASVNSTRTSWARVERPDCPGASPAVFQTGSEDREIKRNVCASLPRRWRDSELSLSRSLPLSIYFGPGLLYDSVLPFTSHNPSIIAQLLFLDVVLEKPWVAWGQGTKCRSRYAPQTPTSIFREC